MRRLQNEPAVVIGVLASIVMAVATRDYVSVVPLVSGLLTRYFVWGPKTVETITEVVDTLSNGLRAQSPGVFPTD